MKTLYLKAILLCSLLPLSFLACKDDDKLEATLSVETLAGKYKLVSLTGETAFTPKFSLMGKLEGCMLDDIYELKADATAAYYDAGQTCEPANNYTFDYEVTSNAVRLIGLHQDKFDGGIVKQWDGKTLVLSTKVKEDWTANIETTVVGTLEKIN